MQKKRIPLNDISWFQKGRSLFFIIKCRNNEKLASSDGEKMAW
jgi:hypothetical protein